MSLRDHCIIHMKDSQINCRHFFIETVKLEPFKIDKRNKLIFIEPVDQGLIQARNLEWKLSKWAKIEIDVIQIEYFRSN